MSENTLSPEERADLKAFAENATQGPWKAEGTIYEHMAAEIRCIVPGDERGIAQVWQHEKGFADARFIAAANPSVILSLLASLEEADEREKHHGVARFVDAEEIAELMEAGARTWMPMELAKPVKGGSILVMTTDDKPVIGQAFWHEHGDGTWALHWSAVSPKEDCWNDPITETNKGLACWQPMPEGPCEARVKAMGSPGPHIAALLRIKALEEAAEALTARAEKAEQMAATQHETLVLVQQGLKIIRAGNQDEINLTLPVLEHGTNAALSLSPSNSQADQ